MRLLFSLILVVCIMKLSAEPYFSEYQENGFIIIFQGDVTTKNIPRIKSLERKYIEEMNSLVYMDSDIPTQLEELGVSVGIIKDDPNVRRKNDPTIPANYRPRYIPEIANNRSKEMKVTCILNDGKGNITHIGGNWGLRSAKDAIDDIESGKVKYFVDCNGQHRVKVEVKYDKNPPYLKTVPDGRECNNLDHLPSCSDNS